MKDYYNILKIDKKASHKDVKKAYIRSIKNCTDKNIEKNQLKDIQKAYYVLGDYHNRRKYDNYLENKIPSNLIIPSNGRSMGVFNGLATSFFNYMNETNFNIDKSKSNYYIKSQTSVGKVNKQGKFEMQTKTYINDNGKIDNNTKKYTIDN